MNPYAFVRFGKPGPKEEAIKHERFTGHSGCISCRLTARTHLFIPKTQSVSKVSHTKLQLMRGPGRVPLLPGSSLKGVVRSVAEAISGSCLVLPQPRGGKVEYRGRPSVSYRIPKRFEHCRDADHLCPACRLFGSLSGGKAFLGKVALSDALAVGDTETEWITIEALMEPKPRHKAWYEDPDQRGVMRGRKFYYHRPAGPRLTAKKDKYNKTVEAVKPDAVFEFSVEYTNLTDDELALLVFALVLEPEMCHKVGMGKPVGLGSAKIEIVKWEQIDRQARYRRIGSGVTVLEADALGAEVARWREEYQRIYADWATSLADLRRIWTWDPDTTEDVRYPGQSWFRNNPQVPLDESP